MILIRGHGQIDNLNMHNRSSPGILSFSVLFLLITMTASGQTESELRKITQKLEQVYALDQGVRKKLGEAEREHGFGSEEHRKKTREMIARDSANRDIVFGIIDRYGWIGKASSSETASRAIFYVIQHADLEAQLKYMELVRQAFAGREISAAEYAIFEDRVNVRQGRYQLYGTQSAVDLMGNNYLYPIDNVDSVNARRTKAGLWELSQQIAQSNIRHVLPTGDSPQHDIVLIAHVWDTSNAGVEHVSMWHGDRCIGETDPNGFLFVKYAFFQHEAIEMTFKVGEKVVGQIPLNKGRDFYEMYIQIASTVKTEKNKNLKHLWYVRNLSHTNLCHQPEPSYGSAEKYQERVPQQKRIRIPGISRHPLS